ncbi:hypothetical protein DL98DRAFT_586662 [Cadophora sp. DSE1049]|nr:hypothetical protein DL98DRAFT_586662 [Cadophora sp. DSE1049]
MIPKNIFLYSTQRRQPVSTARKDSRIPCKTQLNTLLLTSTRTSLAVQHSNHIKMYTPYLINILLALLFVMRFTTAHPASKASVDVSAADSANTTDAYSAISARGEVSAIHLEDGLPDFVACEQTNISLLFLSIYTPSDFHAASGSTFDKSRCTIAYVENTNSGGFADLRIYDPNCRVLGTHLQVSRADLAYSIGEDISQNRGYTMASELRYYVLLYIPRGWPTLSDPWDKKMIQTRYGSFDQKPFFLTGVAEVNSPVFKMRSSKSSVIVLVTFIIFLLTSLFTTTLAAPASISEILDMTAEEISNITSIETYPDTHLNRRDDLTFATVLGNPTTGEYFNPEPKVKFQSCKPRQDVPQMCTMAYARKTTTNDATLIAYDHNCNRLGDWKRNIVEMRRLDENGEKHGSDFVTPKLKWNILIWMDEDWQGYPFRNFSLKIYYGWYVSFPFFWRDWPEKWRASDRIQSGFWKGTYYDFFRVPFNCGDEYL